MDNRTMLKKAKKYSYFYHKCRKHQAHGDVGCPHGKNHRAEKLEAAVWKVVSGLLQDPKRLQNGLEDIIERERAEVRGDPARQAKVWLDKLAEADRKRSRFQDMAAEGYITFTELGAKLRELDENREMAERELDGLNRRRAHIEELERDKASLLNDFAAMIPEALEELTGEERHQIYCMLRLELYVSPEGDLNISGAIGNEFCAPEATPSQTAIRFNTKCSRRAQTCHTEAR